MLFNGPMPPPVGDLDPIYRHLDRFNRFCRARECDQQTDKQTHTDRPRYSVYSNSIYLMQRT